MTPLATLDTPRPVLVIGGLDPTTGAGITADCAAVVSLGAHPLAVLTASTAQNTHAVTNSWPVTATQLREQIMTLLAEWQPAAIKIGLIPNSETASCLVDIFASANTLPPLVVDPVCVSSSGSVLSTASKDDWMQLLQLSTVCTPNHREALHLSGADTISAAIARLSEVAQAVLLTGTDSSSGDCITHHLYRNTVSGSQSHEFVVQRQVGHYHGSGCALASAIATHLALGLELESAISTALADVERWMALAFLPSTSSQQKILRHQ